MRRLAVGGVARMAERLNDTGAARYDCWREDLRKAQERRAAEEKRRQEQLRIPRPRFRPEKGPG